MLKALCVPLLLFICSIAAFAQEIPVDMYTGKPSITIPLWTVTSGDISEPVVLSYDANSAQQESFYGAGFNLLAGGTISRDVRTYPDDVGYGVTTQGWFYNNSAGTSIASYINNFIPTADTLASTYTDEYGSASKDYERISGFNYLVDTEPDIFSYNFGTMSGSFIFDNGLVIRTMPYQDIKIDVTYTSASDRNIQSFTITTNTGYVYKFDHKVVATKETIDKSYGSAYTTTEFELYNPKVTYTKEWKLTRIDSPNGYYVTFTYGSDNKVSGQTFEIAQYQYYDPTVSYASNIIIKPIYTISEEINKAYITKITASTGTTLDFTYGYGGTFTTGPLESVTIKDSRYSSVTASGEQYVKRYELGYKAVGFSSDKYATYGADRTLQFLMEITETSGCERLPPYKFDYRGITYLDYRNPGDYIIRFGYGVDLWGYPNLREDYEHLFPQVYIYPDEPPAERYRYSPIPQSQNPGREIILEGAQRTCNASGILQGSLTSITNPSGGVTEFAFEGNTYFDTRASLDVNAGGVRIKSISYYDGFNQTPVTKTFEYKDPTGKSSGRLIQRPVLAMPAFKWKSPNGYTADKTSITFIAGSDDLWRHLTIRTTYDISSGEMTQGNTVGYQFVTVKRPGAGAARYEYEVPATYGQYHTGDWFATTNRIVRNANIQLGAIADKSGAWFFPFTVNPDHDYMRGLPIFKYEFNEAGKLVRKTTTTYQYINASANPVKVSGLKYERYLGSEGLNKIFFYGKYQLQTEKRRVPLKETVMTYDINDATGSTYLTESTEYVYGSANHKLLTKTIQTTSDGLVYTTQLKYPSDYGFVTTGASESIMIGNLKTANRHGLPIEQIQTLTRNDSTFVIGGKVIKLDPMGLSRPMVRSTWQLITSPPILLANFTNSYVSNLAGGYKFKIDPRYERVDSVLSYTQFGAVKASYNPLTRQSAVTGYGYSFTTPVVQLVNAGEGQAAFSDFETSTDFSFTYNSSLGYFGTGRSGQRASHMSVSLNKTITRASDVNNYILSFWVKSNTTLTFNIILRSSSGSTTYSTQTLSVPSTTSQYKYYQKVIPLTNVPTTANTTFAVEISVPGLATPAGLPSGVFSATLDNVVDDVFFYPENADMTSTTLQIPFGATSVTSATGNTAYTEYDKLGRIKLIRDKDRNIVKRMTYQYTTENPLPASFTITKTDPFYEDGTATFKVATNDCVTDATYEWDWGTGTFTSGTPTQTHTFTTVGDYTVKMRVNSPLYGTKTIEKTIKVLPPLQTASLCAKGTIGYQGGTPVSATCAYITETPAASSAIFLVTVNYDDAVPQTLSYKWQKRDLTSDKWVLLSGTAKYTATVTSSTPSFEIRCVVTSSKGWSITSSTMQFVNN